jgi:predicted TIM-barrel fold metal-dependent hydrolase
MTASVALPVSLPSSLEPYFGRIIDVDSHEMMPTKVWTQEFGTVAADLVEIYKTWEFANEKNPNNQYIPDFVADDMPIDQDSIWATKGARAPGATDMHRRVDVLDTMGIDRQLLFPTSVGLIGAMVRTGHGAFSRSGANLNPKTYSRQLFDAHNEWAIRAQRVSPRLRPVAVVQADSPEEVLEMAQGVVAGGIRAIWLISSELLGGKSPAHAAHDPLWDLLASNNVTATLHVGDGTGFLKTEEWGGAEAFSGFKESMEVNLAPWHMAVMHMAIENYVRTMVLGGVFDRHPTLRLGAIEVGAYWLGPLAQQLDVIEKSGGIMRSKKVYRLPEPPSYYLRNNVRVSAFDWEPVDQYIETYREQGIEDILCFASDYPHVEGGREPLTRFANKLERLGPEIMEKFLISNGAFLLG